MVLPFKEIICFVIFAIVKTASSDKKCYLMQRLIKEPGSATYVIIMINALTVPIGIQMVRVKINFANIVQFLWDIG